MADKKYSKAHQRATAKYVKNHYDRLIVTVSKGRKDEIKQVAESMGMSMNAFIVSAIDEKMRREMDEKS